jgi:hypothetical protein
VNAATTVLAILYYQTIPHYYYLVQRATHATGIDTDRLVRLTRNLKVAKTPVGNWVLSIATGESAIP